MAVESHLGCGFLVRFHRLQLLVLCELRGIIPGVAHSVLKLALTLIG
jgi:hypothetical protein